MPKIRSKIGMVRNIGFHRLQWLFPLAVTLDNIEEAIWMPAWVAKHADQLPYVISAREFWFGILVLTAAAYVITYLSARQGRESIWTYLLFGYIVAMLVNVFVPHVPAAFIFRSYAPGLITAVAVNLPVMTFLLVRALREGYVSGSKAVMSAIAVPLGIAGSIPVLFWFCR